MMPRAGFLLSHVPPLSCPMGGKESQLQSVMKGRCSPPSSPAALYSSSCIFMRHHNM
jgi:hypothetical protein